MRTNEPNMNITNQINSGLNDVRATLIDVSCHMDNEDRDMEIAKAKYQLDLIIRMVTAHQDGVASIPWSDRKWLVDEEFS